MFKGKRPSGALMVLQLLITALLSACGTSPAAPPVSVPASRHYDPQKFIVRYNVQAIQATSNARVLAAALSDHVGQNAKVNPLTLDTFAVEMPAGADAEAKIAELRSDASVAYVEHDFKQYAFFTPDDPQFAQQWHHTNLQSEKAWDVGQGSENIIVADVDTGLDYNHPDIAANVWTNADGTHGYNFVANTTDPMADDTPHYHGTHTAGIIGAIANNGVGVAGVSPHVKIMPLKFLGSDGSGDTSNAVLAIDWGIAHGAKIMNNSWGSSDFSQTLQDAITRAKNAGVLFIAAAGNGNSAGVGQDNDQTPTYPASYPVDNIVAVAATNNSDQLTVFSNFGATTVHVAAPGSNILSLMNNRAYQLMSGTSMATPMVTGVAALILGLKPTLTYTQVKSILVASVDQVSSLKGKVISGGRVNSFRALQLASGTTPEPQPSGTATPTPTPLPTPTYVPPTPTPTPTPPVSGGVAPPPVIDGQVQIKLTNPQQPVAVQYNVTAVPGAVGIYFEVTRPNATFADPNGVAPDPNHLIGVTSYGPTGQWVFIPAKTLPGWGEYQMRLIPLNQAEQPVARFSNPSLLLLSPQ